MTPTDKQHLWNAIKKLNNMPYTGSGYPAYDNIKNPALRGGRYYWMYPQMRELYEQLVKYCELGESEACWRVLLGYKTKIYPAYLRKIYQSLNCGTGPVVLPSVTTASFSNANIIGNSSGGGNVTSSGGATVTARGVCYSTNPNPTLGDSFTTNGTGTGVFTTNLTLLPLDTTYYVRAYATNSAGTAYGNEVTFTTHPSFVFVGTQNWGTKNLNVTTYRNGDPIPFAADQTDWDTYASTNTGAWRYYNDDPSTELIYGKWYNSFAMQDARNLAPAGYHLPTVYEYTYLNDYLVSQSEVLGGLKNTDLNVWNAPNSQAANLYLYEAVPGGAINVGTGGYSMGAYGYYWVYGQDAGYPYYMSFGSGTNSAIIEFDATTVGNGMTARLIDNASLVRGQLFGGGLLLENLGTEGLTGFKEYTGEISNSTGGDEVWGPLGAFIGATDALRGFHNTQTMSTNTSNIISQVLANNLQIINGYNDWYIPAINEIIDQINVVPEFASVLDTTKKYWTSTEYDADFAYAIQYVGGSWTPILLDKDRVHPFLGVRKQQI